MSIARETSQEPASQNSAIKEVPSMLTATSFSEEVKDRLLLLYGSLVKRRLNRTFISEFKILSALIDAIGSYLAEVESVARAEGYGYLSIITPTMSYFSNSKHPRFMVGASCRGPRGEEIKVVFKPSWTKKPNEPSDLSVNVHVSRIDSDSPLRRGYDREIKFGSSLDDRAGFDDIFTKQAKTALNPALVLGLLQSSIDNFKLHQWVSDPDYRKILDAMGESAQDVCGGPAGPYQSNCSSSAGRPSPKA